LPFARPSPPSGWPEDLHLRVIEHAWHTRTRPAACAAGRVAKIWRCASIACDFASLARDQRPQSSTVKLIAKSPFWPL
jgi:hypothetical protein